MSDILSAVRRISGATVLATAAAISTAVERISESWNMDITLLDEKEASLQSTIDLLQAKRRVIAHAAEIDEDPKAKAELKEINKKLEAENAHLDDIRAARQHAAQKQADAEAAAARLDLAERQKQLRQTAESIQEAGKEIAALVGKIETRLGTLIVARDDMQRLALSTEVTSRTNEAMAALPLSVNHQLRHFGFRTSPFFDHEGIDWLAKFPQPHEFEKEV